MQSLLALKPKSNWFRFVTFIVQELRSLTVIGAIFCILYKESVKSAPPWESPLVRCYCQAHAPAYPPGFICIVYSIVGESV